MARQTRSQRRARREAREASAAAAPAPQRTPRRVAQTATPAGDGARTEAAQPRERRGGGIAGFVRESVAELKKVDWPNQTQVITGTTVVLIACLIVGFYLYLNDEIWKRVVQHVFLR